MQKFMGDFLGENIPVTGSGTENFPRSGAALVIANHRCWLDPVFIARVVPRPIQWGGIDFHFKIPVVRRIAAEAGIIPIHVEGGKKSSESIRIASDILKKSRNDLVGLFPEGAANFLNPSDEEKIIRFHTGFARIALDAKVPVIPVAVVGKKERQIVHVPGAVVSVFTPLEAFKEHGATLLLYGSAHIEVGKPISLEKYYDKPLTKELLHRISSHARKKVIELYEKGLRFRSETKPG